MPRRSEPHPRGPTLRRCVCGTTSQDQKALGSTLKKHFLVRMKREPVGWMPNYLMRFRDSAHDREVTGRSRVTRSCLAHEALAKVLLDARDARAMKRYRRRPFVRVRRFVFNCDRFGFRGLLGGRKHYINYLVEARELARFENVTDSTNCGGSVSDNWAKRARRRRSGGRRQKRTAASPTG